MKSVSRFLLLGSLVWCLILHPVAAQDKFAALSRVVTAELDETQTPGAIVAIVQDRKVVFVKAFGVANVETHQPMTPDMDFPLASMTKMYTASAVLELAEEGKIDLQAPIGKYIDNLPAKLATVTPHQLLTHTAGFRDDAGISNRGYDDSTIDEQVRAYTDAIFLTEPGTLFSYANQGFNISGLLIQRVSGKRYSQVIQERLFAPLGMPRSTFSLAMAATYPLPQTHAGRAGGPPAIIRPMAALAPWPVGGMFSTMDDLARYATAFMDDGQIDGKQVIPAAVIKLMSTPHVPIRSQVEGGQYGYGLETMELRGVRIIEHGGTLAGSATDFAMAPSKHVAVIVFANRQSHLTRTMDAALETMLPFGPKPAPPKPLPMSADDVAAYVGRYSQAPPGTPIAQVGGVEVVRTDAGGLGFRNGTGVLPLTRIDRDVFLVPFPGFTDPIRVEFIRGSDGAIQFLHHRLRALKRVVTQ